MTEKRLKLDLNHATKDQLATLPGVDEDLAGRIIEYRKVHGGFRSVDELRNVGPLPGVRIEDLEAEVFV